MMNKYWLTLLVALLLTGCGQSGKLYLPEPADNSMTAAKHKAS